MTQRYGKVEAWSCFVISYGTAVSLRALGDKLTRELSC